MKIKDIWDVAIKEGMRNDPRSMKELRAVLKERKKAYEPLKGIRRDIVDKESLTNPFCDSRVIYGADTRDVDQAWIGINAGTEDLLLIKKLTEKTNKKPLVIAHHPTGKGSVRFPTVLEMQTELLVQAGVSQSIADSLTRKRISEIDRKLSAGNPYSIHDSARHLDLPLMNLHTPADNHVHTYLAKYLAEKQPRKLKDLVDALLEIQEYKDYAKCGKPPVIVAGNENNKIGKIFMGMTGGTSGDAELIKHLAAAGVSTFVGMHMPEDQFKLAGDVHMNVVIAGHISSDNLGMNLLLDGIIKKLGKIEIKEFQGFRRVDRIR